MKDESVTIRPAPNGPYIVEGLQRLHNSEGPMQAQAKMALCRCGASKQKPFCDGTHAQIGFQSAELADRTPDQLDSYAGRAITIHDNRGICAHAGKCTDGLPSVWRMKQEPWIDPDGAEVSEIMRVIRSCPSGALSYTLAEGPSESTYEGGGEPTVSIAKNGPYVVHDVPHLEGALFAEGANKRRYTLCRCGASKCKPFCDGSHWSVGFDDERD